MENIDVLSLHSLHKLPELIHALLRINMCTHTAVHTSLHMYRYISIPKSAHTYEHRPARMPTRMPVDVTPPQRIGLSLAEAHSAPGGVRACVHVCMRAGWRAGARTRVCVYTRALERASKRVCVGGMATIFVLTESESPTPRFALTAATNSSSASSRPRSSRTCTCLMKTADRCAGTHIAGTQAGTHAAKHAHAAWHLEQQGVL